MGHTVTSQRRCIDRINTELSHYRKTLNREEQKRFDKLTGIPFSKAGAITSTGSLHTWGFYLLSILLQQQEELDKLTTTCRRLEEKERSRLLAERWLQE